MSIDRLIKILEGKLIATFYDLNCNFNFDIKWSFVRVIDVDTEPA